jgi:cytoskeletal protein RodZ
MKALIKSLLLVTAILLCFAFTGCTTTATPEEPAQEEPEEPELPEEEITEEEDESEEETTKSGSQSTTSGSGFQHTVKMEIDGVVETDKNEGWWNID